MKRYIVFLATLLLLLASAIHAQPDFTEHVLSDEYWNSNTIDVIDVDGDGDLDVISSRDGSSGELGWWENLGELQFDYHLIQSLSNPARLMGGDLTGDGLVDIVVAFDHSSRILWWENQGANSWAVHTITDYFPDARSIDLVDMDGDGDLDVLSCGQYRVTWFENLNSYFFPSHDLDADFPGAAMAVGQDFDLDGDVDVFGAAYIEGETAWWENDGDQNFSRQNLPGSPDDPHWLEAADLDGDQDLDVLVSSRDDNLVMWYENTGSAFTPHPIALNIYGAQGMAAADYDNDGDNDFIVAARAAGVLLYFDNDGGLFSGSIVGSGLTEVGYVSAGNFDGDGDIDFVASCRLGHRISVWESHANDLTESLTINLEPFNPPVILPPVGGTVYFTATISNGTDADFAGVGWANALTPNGNPIYFQEVFPISVAAGSEVTYPYLQLNCPYWAPAGDYVFQGVVGEQFHDMLDEDHFSFSKVSGSAVDIAVQDWSLSGIETGDEGILNEMPVSAEFVMTAYPNPFNPTTTVYLELPEAGSIAVAVYDVQGRLVQTLAHGRHPAGRHTFQFDAVDMAAGVYFLRGRAVGYEAVSRKLVLLK
ncbi:T9SS type A sorting domain-containing protein [bacterium]|nr:T9SS type A sorting domain-containing protein [bacterium]